MNHGPSFFVPPDWEPPSPKDAETNRTTLIVVLCVFAAGLAACGLAFVFLR